MAIEAKASFLRQMEKKLETETTASTMAKVLSIMADVMEGFDMREISIEEEADEFRRTLATNLAKRNMPIQTIAAILGHEKIETTMEYIVMNKESTKMQYRQYYAV